jgi:hypothetical protein
MSLKRGEDIFRMWHEKEPRKNESLKVKLLDEPHFAAIGKAVEITYRSDKWERDGDHHLYVHDFESRPKVYLPASHVSEDEQIGKPTKTSTLLGSKANNGRLVVAQLATAVDFTMFDKDNNEVALKLGNGSKMFSTPDKKGLLIITRSGPVIVRGGQMRVTARGIVK